MPAAGARDSPNAVPPRTAKEENNFSTSPPWQRGQATFVRCDGTSISNSCWQDWQANSKIGIVAPHR
jgi:hypothetical protein